MRRRPIRAVLLAAAVFAIPYSLARHQGYDSLHQRIGPVSAPAPAAPSGLSLPLSPIAIERVPGNRASTPWNPPVGMDRTNEALDRLTMDFTSGSPPADSKVSDSAKVSVSKIPGAQVSGGAQVTGPQPAPANQTSEQPSGFPADPRVTSADTATTQSAPARGPEDVPVEDPAAAPAPETPPVAAPAEAVLPKSRVAKTMKPLDTIDQYLWSVYQRSATKRDSSGDFTWKDEAAAAHLGLVTRQYVIGGMDPDFRELLYNLGQAMDAAGVNWTILSGFRDDYRQGLASGYKAHVGNSFHGGSRATGGYGHGCAADIEASDGEGNNAVWKWVDQHGEKYGVFRPMKGIDPAHIQPFGNWHDVALNLRDKRITAENGFLTASLDRNHSEKITSLVDTRSGVSEAQFDCVRSHHHADFRMAGFPHHQRMTMAGHLHRAMLFHPGRMHRFGRRRMVVESGSSHRRADLEPAETVEIVRLADEAGSPSRTADAGHAERRPKAEGSEKNRRDAGQSKVAASKDPSREASASDERNARGHDANAAKVADSKRTYDHLNDSRHAGSKLADGKHADGRRQQKHASAQSSARQTRASEAKARSRIADRDASDKNDGKL